MEKGRGMVLSLRKGAIAMDYNDKMNFNFEPSDGYEPQPRYTAPQQEPAPQQKPERGLMDKKTFKRLAALMIAVALVAGVGGTLITSAIQSISQKNAEEMTPAMSEQEVPAEEPTGEDAETAKGEDKGSYQLVSAPLPESLLTNVGDKSLTPAQVYELNVGAVVGIRTEATTNVFGQVAAISSSGTGFVLTEDGYIVTNRHVVAEANSVSVAMYDGTEYDAEVIGADEMNDVALLKIEAEGLQTVTIGDTDDIVVGEEVIAIGNPLGELTFTMTQGYISALDRSINTDGTPINMMQTDAAINSGNSGGPLFDMNGNVVGVTTATYSGSTSSGTTIEGIGFAIPINDVMHIVYELKEHGYVTDRAYFGISVMDMSLDSATAEKYGLPMGAEVVTVNEGSCAEKAGIQVGDIIIGIDDRETENRTQLLGVLQEYRAGQTATVQIWRNGTKLSLTVTFDSRPPESELNQTTTDQTQPEQDQQQMDPFYGYGYDFGDAFGFGSAG